MKIALISPKGAERFYADRIFEDLESLLHRELIFLMEDMEWMPNLGLLTLAGVIGEKHELVYIDEEYLQQNQTEKLLNEEEFDLAAISVINAQYKRAYEIADIMRARGIKTALGGIHPTALPDEAAAHADYIFAGEAEGTFPEFLADFEAGKAKKVYSSGNPVDLSKLPPPRFELMKQFDYIEKYNRFPIQATRGCPRTCDFCFLHKIYGPKHRHKTVEQVINEVKTITSMVEQPFISFTDENMFVDREYAKELVKALTPLNVLWECYCDISVADDDDLLELLFESHCVLLLIGLESLNPKNLEDFNPWKHNMVKKYRDNIEKIQSAGVGVAGLFIVGFEDDEPEVFEHIRDFALETKLVDIEVSALCPFPGTGLYDRMKAEGRILTENWEKYTWIHMNFQPMKMTPNQILEGLFRLFRDLTGLDRLIYQMKYFKSAAARLYGKNRQKEGKPSFLV